MKRIATALIAAPALALFVASLPAWAGEAAAEAKSATSLAVGYKLDLVRNMRGGLSTGGGGMGHLDVQWEADLGALWGWDGVAAMVNFIDDRGRKVNAERVGSLAGVSNIEVPRSTHRFYQAWLEKSWNAGRTALRVGLYPVDTEFAAMDSAALFVQPPYGAWADFGASRGPSIFNNSTFGARFKWQAESRDLYVMAAAVDGMPGDPDHSIGTNVRFDKGDGTQLTAEIGWQPEDAPENFEKYFAGHWHYTSKVSDLIDTDANGDPINRTSAGWYLGAERTLLRGAGDASLAGFARLSFNDGATISIQRTLNLGLRWKGMLLPGRDADVAGLAWTRVETGAKFRAAQAIAGVDATRTEDSVELTYRVQVTPWLAVQPLIQHIRHPGADRAVPAATLLGLRLELSL